MSKQNKKQLSPLRQAFEDWYTANQTTAPIGRSKRGYNSEITRVAWRAFQAGVQVENTKNVVID